MTERLISYDRFIQRVQESIIQRDGSSYISVMGVPDGTQSKIVLVSDDVGMA